MKSEFEKARDGKINLVLSEVCSTKLETLTLPELNAWMKGYRVGSTQMSDWAYEWLDKEWDDMKQDRDMFQKQNAIYREALEKISMPQSAHWDEDSRFKLANKILSEFEKGK